MRLSRDFKRAAMQRMRNRMEKLYPIHRTLVNEGYKQSLDIISEELPLDILEVPSGKQVHDWIVPNSWNVVKAQIRTVDGKVLVDFKDNNLNLSAYSEPFSGVVSKDELADHINFRKDLPNAIPYNFHYYKSHWSFNVSYDYWLSAFNEEEYEVEIDVEVYPDTLKIGEFFIPGKSEEEVLITTYMCHPSMVNDNLSGVLAATEMFLHLSEQKELEKSYRLIIIPETIGGVAFLSEFPEKTRRVVAGLTVYCCADKGFVHYKRTHGANNYIDRVVDYAFDYYYAGEPQQIPYWPGGSDERQFNSAKVRMPMGALTRTPPAVFKEYHTSLDTPELIQDEDLMDTVEKLLQLVSVIEHDGTYEATYVGEPCFSRHAIKYPTFEDALVKSEAYNVKILASEIDGHQSLLDIASKWKINIESLHQLALSFVNEGLANRLK